MKNLIKEIYTLTDYEPMQKIPLEEKKRLREETNWTELWRKYMYHKGKLERKALNYIIQGSAASQIKLAAIMFYKNRKDSSQVILCIVHDEIVATCDKGLEEDTKILLETSMIEAGNYITNILPMKAEAIISEKWEH